MELALRERLDRRVLVRFRELGLLDADVLHVAAFVDEERERDRQHAKVMYATGIGNLDVIDGRRLRGQSARRHVRELVKRRLDHWRERQHPRVVRMPRGEQLRFGW